MKSARNVHVVLVTAPDLRVGRQLASRVLKAKLAACVTLLPNAQSHYWWQGKLESTAECVLLIKTARRKLGPLEKLLLQYHPYDTPEILALPVSSGTARYLAWIQRSLR